MSLNPTGFLHPSNSYEIWILPPFKSGQRKNYDGKKAINVQLGNAIVQFKDVSCMNVVEQLHTVATRGPLHGGGCGTGNRDLETWTGKGATSGFNRSDGLPNRQIASCRLLVVLF